MAATKEAAPRRPFEPDYAVPPGATLQETIDELGMSQAELAERTGFSKKHVNQMISGKAAISPGAAIRLERVTGVPARLWNSLEARYQEQKARLEAQKQLEANLEWVKSIPYAEIAKRGRVPQTKNRAERLENVLKFFGVASVDAWKTGWCGQQLAFRKSTAHQAHDGALATWLRLAELQAREKPCRPFNKSKFRKAIAKIRELTVEKPGKFIPRMTALCADAGVAFVLEREIRKAPVSGATKWLGSDKAMIAMTLRGKTEDKFWFTFFHEAGHVLSDDRKEVFVDVEYEDDPEEMSANRFASELLIPAKFEKKLPGLKSKAAVRAFAKQLGIHPGIVVGRMQREGILTYSQMNDLKVKIDWDAIPAS